MTASTNELGTLHKALAVELTERITGYDKTEVTLEGKEVTVKVRASAAELAVAVTMLKNNNITASASDNEELAQLARTLAARKRKKLPQEALDEAARVFESVGGMGGFTQ